MLSINLKKPQGSKEKTLNRINIAIEFLLSVALIVICAVLAYIILEAERNHPHSPSKICEELDELKERLNKLEKK